MKTSNISYLRNHFSEVLSCVKEGETVTVLDRDKPVAKLVPYRIEDDAGSERLNELCRLGLVAHGPSPEPVDLPPLIKPTREVKLSDYIQEERQG